MIYADFPASHVWRPEGIHLLSWVCQSFISILVYDPRLYTYPSVYVYIYSLYTKMVGIAYISYVRHLPGGRKIWSHLPGQAAKGMWSNNRSMRRTLVSKTFLGKEKFLEKSKKHLEPGPWPWLKWPISIRPIVNSHYTEKNSEPIIRYRIGERKEVYKKPSMLIG